MAGFAKLISKIPSSTTVWSTNISLPVVGKVKELSRYITNLANALDTIIFSFYIISLLGSGAVIIGSLVGFLFPAAATIMYSNLFFSIISVLFNLAGTATVTAFITTANNIINLFGSSLGVHAGLGKNFLILTWVSFGMALITNLYVMAIWFFQFRTISVKVQRRSSPQFVMPPPTSPQRLLSVRREQGQGQQESDDTVPTINTFNTVNTYNTTNTLGTFNTRRSSRRQSKQYADF